jgi:mannose-6-phosphate isomerase-like protein (cupin superfamily)
MQYPELKPTITPSNEGRKLFVLGNEITVKRVSHEPGDIYVFEQLTPPGVGVPTHVHHREDEIIRVIDGEFEIFLEGEIFKATAGEVIQLPRLIPHSFRNVGKKPARALFTVIPGANFEKFFEELGALPIDEPADIAVVAEICSRYGIQILGST